MSTSREPLPGVAGLADRPVDGRRVALVMCGVGVLLSIASVLAVEHLLASSNAEGAGGPALRSLPSPSSAASPSRLAVVLVDGLRVDEARALPSLQALSSTAARGTIALPTPTLSRPFYHLLFTGVPPHASGVRNNRFADHARHPSVPDRVRAAGGSVAFVSEGLDWMRRMHGAPGDGGADDASAIEPARLDEALVRFRAAPSPALLVVHVTTTDATAHAEGIDGSAHRAALQRADAVIARVAAEELALVVLSDHGHLARGGHGGPEPEVATAPLVVRAPGLDPGDRDDPIEAVQLAATLAALVGVAAPDASVGAPAEAFLPPDRRAGSPLFARRAALARQGERTASSALASRRHLALPVVVLVALMALGPIKRAFGFDRGVALAIVLWPALVLGAHLALGRPLSLSAIDTMHGHAARVAALGAGAALVALLVARLVGRGPQRTRRVAASVGWSAFACGLFALTAVGFALGPWPLTPLETYLPLLTLGAAAPALLVASGALLASALAERRASSEKP
jgi:hypothetical protein